MLSTLAQATADAAKSSAVEIITAVGGLLGIVLGALGYGKLQRRSGVEEGKRAQGDVTISGQPIAVRKEAGVPTWADVKGIERRVESLEKHMDGLRDAQARQFQQLLEAGHEREIRIRDTIAASIGSLGAKFSGDIRAVHERIEGCMAKHAKDH